MFCLGYNMVFTQLYRLWTANKLVFTLRGFLQISITTLALTSSVVAPAAAQSALIVRNDLGGSVEQRLVMIAALRSEGRRVEIRGQCASSCTLYLGLPNTCVSRASQLGFHGPQSQYYGISLPRDQFEHWSRIMASNYPAPIARWFMAEARQTTMGLITISGAEAIKMGAQAC
jgi:hypothetical protein